MFHLLKRLSTQLLGRDYHLRELLSSSSTAFFLKIGSVVVVYLFQFMVAKIYGSEGNGLFSFCFAILNILMILSMLGLETYLIRFIADYANKQYWGAIQWIYQKALGLTVAMGLILGVLLYFTLPALMDSIGKSEYTKGLQITAIALIPAAVTRLNSEALKGLKKVKLYSLLQNISILAFAMLGIAVLELIRNQQENILWGVLFGEIVVMIWSFYLWRRQTYHKAADEVSPVSNKEMLKTALPLLMASAVFFFMNWTDRIMLGFMASQKDLGVYEVAFKISQLGNMVIFAINTIAAPKFSEFFGKGEMDQFKKMAQQTTGLIVLATLPVIVIILLFPEFLLNIFGAAFIEGKTSLYILAGRTFFTAATGSVVIILNMTGKQKASQFILLIAGILNIGLNYMLIPLYGMHGAAIATLISTILWNGAAMVAIYYYYRFWTFNFLKLLRS